MLSSLLQELTEKSSKSKFYQTNTGDDTVAIFGLFQCRGDLTNESCHNCILNAVSELSCGLTLPSRVQLNGCYLSLEPEPEPGNGIGNGSAKIVAIVVGVGAALGLIFAFCYCIRSSRKKLDGEHTLKHLENALHGSMAQSWAATSSMFVQRNQRSRMICFKSIHPSKQYKGRVV